MHTHPLKQRAVLPQDQQTGLPAGIYFQPIHVGGSLGFGGKPELEPMWDKLEAEAAAAADAGGAPGQGQNLRQRLNDFIFQALTTSELVVPYNADRIYLMMQNVGAGDVFVSFGRGASITPGASFRIAAGGGFYEPILGTTSSVHMITAAGMQSVSIVEGFRT